MRDRGRISTSVRKQTLDKYLSFRSIVTEKQVSASAVSDGYDAGAGYAAVSCGAARLYAQGGIAVRAGVQITLPGGADPDCAGRLSAGAGRACRELGIRESLCEISVLEGTFLPRVTAFVSGPVQPGYKPLPGALPGHALLMAGYAGWRGGAVLAQTAGKPLLEHFSPAFLKPVLTAPESDFSPYRAVQEASAAGAAAWICGEGGIFTAIREFSEQEQLGVRVRLEQILLRQESVEICDFAGVNPYGLMSQGCALFYAKDPMQLQEKLAGAGIVSSVIGYFTGDHDRVVLNGEDTRYLEPFRRDSYYDRNQ